MKKELTPKQKAFADEYVKNGGNATQAALSAGYSAKTAKNAQKNIMENRGVSAVYSVSDRTNRKGAAP